MAAERILVIEDEPGARSALHSLLAEDGYTVCTAANGRAGLARLDDFAPDTILCDFLLPDINGLQILRHVRALSDGEITFVAVTGGGGGAEAESCLREEADFFFSKPIDLSGLRRVLRDVGGRSGLVGTSAASGNHVASGIQRWVLEKGSF